jgi:DNA transformation protein and related proteins
MAISDEIIRHITDLLHAFGPSRSRRMFGGIGLFRDGLMFGLVYENNLYLKVDDENIAEFISRDLQQFRYARQGKLVGLSFYQAPDSAMDDSTEAALWARRSFEAALRAKAGKRAKVRTPRGSPNR